MPSTPIHPTNLCNANSGDPIVQEINGEVSHSKLVKVYDLRLENSPPQLAIIGVVSWGLAFCRAVNAPAVNMGVSHTIDWINIIAAIRSKNSIDFILKSLSGLRMVINISSNKINKS
jgi:hypothetical protein